MGTPVSDMVIMLYILFYTYFLPKAYGLPLGLGLLSLQRQKGEVLNRNSPFLVGAKINLAEI